MSRKNRLVLAGILILATLACDRYTKALAVEKLRFSFPVSLFGGLVRLEYAENTGGFLSLGASLPPVAHFTIFILAVAVFLTVVGMILVRSARLGALEVVGLSLVGAGGLGNLWDRLFHDGTVVDFLLVGYRGVQTGIFNVADIAITTGVILLAAASFRKREGDEPPEAGAEPEVREGGGSPPPAPPESGNPR